MKKNILILCLFMCVFIVKSQNTIQSDKYIEVKVTDTIKVSPDYIEAFIKLNEEHSIYEYTEDNDKEAETTKSAKELSSQLFKKEVEKKISEISSNFIFIEKSEKNFMTKEFDIWNDGYLVKLNNLEEYNRLVDKIASTENTSISLKTMELRNDLAQKERLLAKTMKSAYNEANQIANMMNVILDKPIMVKNYNANEYSTSDMFSSATNNYYSLLIGMMGNAFQNANKETQVVLNKTLIVRYSYK